MNQDGRKRVFTRLRITAAVFALLLGWLSPALRLMASEPDVCEMECCIAAGHCCCATRHAYVKGHEPKPGDVSVDVETTVTSPCPAGCAASRISAQNNLQRATQAQAPLTTHTHIRPGLYRDRFLFWRQSESQPSSPRAPPACAGLIA